MRFAAATALVISAGLACAAAASARPAPPAPPAGPTAAQVAEAVRPTLPRVIRPGTSLVAIAAEGRTMILTIEGPAAEIEGVPMERIASEFTSGFCAGGGGGFFSAGNSLRVDPQIAGSAPRRGIVVDRCPPPAQPAPPAPAPGN